MTLLYCFCNIKSSSKVLYIFLIFFQFLQHLCHPIHVTRRRVDQMLDVIMDSVLVYLTTVEIRMNPADLNVLEVKNVLGIKLVSGISAVIHAQEFVAKMLNVM